MKEEEEKEEEKKEEKKQKKKKKKKKKKKDCTKLLTGGTFSTSTVNGGIYLNMRNRSSVVTVTGLFHPISFPIHCIRISKSLVRNNQRSKGNQSQVKDRRR